jgi:hypothetical protein
VTDDEPEKVRAARAAVEQFQGRMKVYNGGIAMWIVAIVVAAGAQLPEPAILSLLAVYVTWAIGGLLATGAPKIKGQHDVVKEWDSRALREEFDRFDHKSSAEGDPRLEAARSVARQVQALTASDPGTDAMVDGLVERLRRLTADHAAAAGAVTALRAAGAGAAGTDRLEAAAARVDAEIARILDGLSELYATLLEVEQGRAATTDSLGAVKGWLAAEAELAQAAEQAEAMRPARGGRRAVQEG